MYVFRIQTFVSDYAVEGYLYVLRRKTFRKKESRWNHPELHQKTRDTTKKYSESAFTHKQFYTYKSSEIVWEKQKHGFYFGARSPANAPMDVTETIYFSLLAKKKEPSKWRYFIVTDCAHAKSKFKTLFQIILSSCFLEPVVEQAWNTCCVMCIKSCTTF